MKIYEHEGKQYVETGERTVKGGKSKIGTVYNWSVMGDDHVGIVTEDGTWGYENKILRLATPEEIAGTEKKMCPAGCGADYGAHASHQGCPWFKALLKKSDLDSTADCSAYADAHWREFVKYEVGVDLGKEPSKSAAMQPERANDDNVAPAQPAILPTWTDGDVRAELVRLKLFEKNGPFLEPAKMRHALHAFQVQIRILEAGRSEAENAIKAAAERGEEVANDRRTEHVPIAKSWRGLGIAK